MSAVPSAAPAPDPAPPRLRRALEALAGEASRTLSIRVRARIDVSLRGVRAARTLELATALGPLDRAVALGLGAGAAIGLVLVPRSLADALLALRFGGGLAGLSPRAPERPYTRIESRSLERTARELWDGLAGVSGGWLPAVSRIEGLEDAARLRERSDTGWWVATLELRGVGQLEPLWIAIPALAGREVWDESKPLSGGSHEDEEGRGVDTQGTDAPGARGSGPTPASPPPRLRPFRSSPVVEREDPGAG